MRSPASAPSAAPQAITDHGCQFLDRFRNALKSSFGIKLEKGRARSHCFNGKSGRFIRTFRWWQRLTLFYLFPRSMQKRLDVYRRWYNTIRPQWNLNARTPDEMWYGIPPPVGMPCRERDPVKPAMNIQVKHFRGDPHLSILEIEVIREAKRVA